MFGSRKPRKYHIIKADGIWLVKLPASVDVLELCSGSYDYCKAYVWGRLRNA